MIRPCLFTISTIIIVLLLASIDFNARFKKPPMNIPKQESSINVDENFLSVFSLGQKRMISSFLWVITLLESDLKHYKKKDLNSWMYLRFSTISKIDPSFYENYLFGGQYLSVIKDDLQGAKEIYEKGLKSFPEDFWLNYHAAFHYYFELHDTKKALGRYEKIQDHPEAKSIPYLSSLIARLKSEVGDLPAAYELIRILYENTEKDSLLKEKYFENLYNIKAEIDLHCLNSQEEKVEKKKEECNREDLEGQPYVRKEGRFIASKEWQLFRSHKRENK